MSEKRIDLKVYRQSESIWYAVESSDKREYTVHYQIDHNISYPDWDVYDDKGDEVRGPLRDMAVDAVSEFRERGENAL